MSEPKLNLSLLGQSAPSVGARTDLIIGQVANGETTGVFERVNAMTKAELDTAFGARSELRNRIQAWIDTNKRYSRLDVQALEEDDTAVAAAGAIGVTGTATAAGSVEVNIVSKAKFSADIDILIGDDASTVIGKIVSSFSTTNFPMIPVDVEDGGTEVTITAIDKGTVGNYYSFSVIGSVAGLVFTTTDMTSGATDPAYTASDWPTGTRYTGVMMPGYLGAADVVADKLDDLFNSDNAINDGVCFTTKVDTLSNILTYLDDFNSKSLVVMGNKEAPTSPAVGEIYSGAAIVHPADWSVAAFMGIRSIRITDGAPIADYVQAGGLDTGGGPSLASLPYFNTPLTGTPVAPAKYLFSESEKRQLETAGYAVIDVNPSETAVITGSVPTYRFDTVGAEDDTFKYLNFVDTGSICREYMFNNMKVDLAQSRLTEGDLIAGRNIENAASIESKYMRYYGALADLALTQAGGEIASKVSQSVNVTLSLADRRVTLVAKMPVVTQVGQVNMPITMVFSI